MVGWDSIRILVKEITALMQELENFDTDFFLQKHDSTPCFNPIYFTFICKYALRFPVIILYLQLEIFRVWQAVYP